MPNQHRQGDVFLLRIKEDSIPRDAVKTEDNIVKRGEATGHAHRMIGGQCQILKHDQDIYIVVESPTQLVHEEHETHIIVPAAYRMYDQVQYNPYTKAAEKVQD